MFSRAGTCGSRQLLYIHFKPFDSISKERRGACSGNHRPVLKGLQTVNDKTKQKSSEEARCGYEFVWRAPTCALYGFTKIRKVCVSQHSGSDFLANAPVSDTLF